MAITDKTTLKNWFRNKLKPTQEQFWAWMDSFWHKSEQIPTASIDGLDKLLAGAATVAQLEALENSFQDSLEDKVDKVAGKQLSTEDFTTLLKQKIEIIDLTTKLDTGEYEGTAEDLYDYIQTLKESEIAFEFSDVEAGTAKTYTLDIKADHDYNIISAVLETDDGTLTGVQVVIDATPVTNLDNVTVDNSADETPATDNNSVTAGSRVYLVVSAGYTGVPTLIRGKIKIKRVL